MSGLCLYVSVYDAPSIFILFFLNVSLIYLTILSFLFYLIRCLHPSLSLHLTPGLSPCPFSYPSSSLLLPPSSSLSLHLPFTPFPSLSQFLPHLSTSLPSLSPPTSLSPLSPFVSLFPLSPLFLPSIPLFFPYNIISPPFPSISLLSLSLPSPLPSLSLSLSPSPSACYKSSITRLTFNHQQLFNTVPDPASPGVTTPP